MMELGNGVRLGLLQASLGTTMEHYAGIDVSLESASLCVVDATGRIASQSKALVRHGADPGEALAAVLGVPTEDVRVRNCGE
jgi:hypothetical protein